MLHKNICVVFVINMCIRQMIAYHKSVAWSGGPLHLSSDLAEWTCDIWTANGRYVKENIVAIKAISYNDDVYVITPRIKTGVPATVWQILHEKQGVELLPFPNLRAHTLADCQSIQNAIDFHLDHLGQLWILDSGIIETEEQPQCVCSPKVVVLSVILGKISRSFDLSSLTVPSSLLQNVAVEHGVVGKPYVYVSDAARGAILVYDTAEGGGWAVLACAPAAGLQLALVRRGPAHAHLVLVRLQHRGIIEVDTALLKRKMSPTLTVLGEQTKAVSILGHDIHHVYFRHIECSDVLRWDARRPYDSAHLDSVHSSGPHLSPTSVAADPLKPFLVVLESNYGDALLGNLPTYHRINYINIL